MVLIDQHAAHERVAFQRLRERHRAQTVQVQRLLFPQRVELDAGQSAAARDGRDGLAAVGFELEPFGGTSFAISAVPAGLRGEPEPVLRELLSYMSRDEFRHSASAGDVLKQRIDRDPAAKEQVLAAAEQFRHYGRDVVDVPVAEENDFEAIMAVNRKIRLLCGLAPTEHLKESIPGGH